MIRPAPAPIAGPVAIRYFRLLIKDGIDAKTEKIKAHNITNRKLDPFISRLPTRTADKVTPHRAPDIARKRNQRSTTRSKRRFAPTKISALTPIEIVIPQKASIKFSIIQIFTY